MMEGNSACWPVLVGFLLSNLVKAGMIELDSIQGSVYLLVILAAAGMKTKIRCIAMDMILRLHHAIRRPLEGETEEVGKAVIEDLIPAISMLREQFDVRFKTMFSMTLLLEEQTLPNLLASNLVKSDKFFDSITFNAIVMPRDMTKWGPCLKQLARPQEPVEFFRMQRMVLSMSENADGSLLSGSSASWASSPMTCDGDGDGEDDILIPDHALEALWNPIYQDLSECANIKVKYNPGNKKERFHYTAKQCKLAEAGPICHSLEEFEAKLQGNLSSGVKEGHNYIRLQKDIFEGKRFAINDKNGNPLVIGLRDIPEDIRAPLLKGIKMTFANKGHLALPNVPPCQLTRNSIPVRTSSTMPRTSKEIQRDSADYNMLQRLFQELFAWIKKMLKELLPKEYRILNCKGGDLCFEELGVALELMNGHAVLFASPKLTHFNTLYEGECCSLVFHTDRSGLNWIYGRNG
ncbi:hypothetical protein CPB84DRAFT_1754688 [Gymnopilus junonius]|uniref:Uncharacterized protein n=1 Tax=Gymnopilus junonius TaxID=109634 RepID=A0A9P5N6U1_GYMJU|nr:hypothetical protein CPB84DRAFT_1754688 [Gymnopilus junonius]